MSTLGAEAAGVGVPSDASAGGTLIPVDQLMTAYNTANSNMMGALGGVTQQMQAGNSAIQQDQQGIAAGAKVDQAINAVKTDAAIKLERDKHGYAASVGADPDASSYVLTAMADSILNSNKKIDTMAAANQDELSAYTKKASVGLFDDPIQWMVNQFTLPQEAYTYNLHEAALSGVTAQRDQKLQVMREMMTSVTEAGTMLSSLDQANATKMGLLQDQGIAAAANRNLAESQLKAVSLNLQGIQLKDAINKNSFDMLMQQNSMMVQRENLALEQTRTHLDELRTQYTDVLKDIQIEARNDSVEGTRLLQGYLTKAATVLGRTPPSVIEYKTMTPKQRSYWDAVMSDPNMMDVNSTGRFGVTPGEALDTSIGVNAQLAPGAKMTQDKLQKFRTDFIASKDITWKQLAPEAQKADLDQAYTDYVKQQTNSIPVSGGLYSAPPLRAIIAGNSAIAQFQIAKELAPFIEANPTQATDPNLLMKTAMKLITAGKMTTDQAADEIAVMYRGAMTVNNQLHQYSKFALPGMTPETTGFRQNVTLGTGGFNSSRVVDFSNPARVKDMFLESALQDVRIKGTMQNLGLIKQGK